MPKIIIYLTLLLLSVTTLKAQYKHNEIAFKEGEELVYTVAYKWSFINQDVATATFRVSSDTYNGTPSYSLHAQARVLKSFNWFFNLNDQYFSMLEKHSLRPLEARSEIEEGKYRYSSRYTFNWSDNLVSTYSLNHNRKTPKLKTMPLSDISYDGLSIFYNLRSTEMDKLAHGSDIHLVISDTVRVVRYKFVGRESKKIPSVGTFKTMKFSCELATSTGESFDDGDEFFMWVSDDKNKIPLYFESPIRVGKVRAYISSFANLKYPLSSKIK